MLSTTRTLGADIARRAKSLPTPYLVNWLPHGRQVAILGVMTHAMSADRWVPVHRDDGELIGFVAEDAQGWRALTVFGHPIAGVLDREGAEEQLHAVGLSYLAEKWHLRDGEDWISVQLVEASPVGVTVQLVDFFDHADRYGERQHLAAPVSPDRLRPA